MLLSNKSKTLKSVWGISTNRNAVFYNGKQYALLG